jgi:malate dehydrogenase
MTMSGLKIDEFLRAKMDATAKELVEEKLLAYSGLLEVIFFWELFYYVKIV